MNTHPVIWSVAGTDCEGGAGLAADQRAADAFDVHLCGVVSAVTAQNTTQVSHIQPISIESFEAQLQALELDMPPRVIKTGMLASAAHVERLVQCLDRMRRQNHVALVVDPVLRASTGQVFANDALLAAYRSELIPRANVVTPNQSEAQTLLGQDALQMSVPEQAKALREMGAKAVIITGGDANQPLACDWLDSTQAQGWLSLPRVDTQHHHGTGCTFASALAGGIARGFVTADAAILAKMAATHALAHARCVGAGAGPVIARADFIHEPRWLPQLSWDATAPVDCYGFQSASTQGTRMPGLYAIVDSSERVNAVMQVRPPVDTVQLRMKQPAHQNMAAWQDELTRAIKHCLATSQQTGVLLVINDHWQTALRCGARALHLGQEDVAALSSTERQELSAAQQRGVLLGISSHSLWELCRAKAFNADWIACGPIWATQTKNMLWHPQGLANLAWWARVANRPVIGIGGVLAHEQLRRVSAAGAAGGCVVSGIGNEPNKSLPQWRKAWQEGISDFEAQHKTSHTWPHPSLSDEGVITYSAGISPQVFSNSMPIKDADLAQCSASSIGLS